MGETAVSRVAASVPAFYFGSELGAMALNLASTYQCNRPFPHIVIDGFLPEETADRLLEEFPASSQIRWRRHVHLHSRKLACNDLTQMGTLTRHVLNELNSSAFTNFLEELTGITGLVPDPHFEGGGMHLIESGGRLEVHADFNVHPRLRLDRRLNALLYLNRDWKEEYGGHLELWNRTMTQCEQRIAPIFNRLVVFNTTDTSYHGHPQPLACPPSFARRSLATYYYSNGRPQTERSIPHSTLYQNRPGSKPPEFS